ncbi:MAG: leucyl/phenylalanyl-tRNA--protein transferase [Ignavibacteria bacterium]|nr:leucyl/phenylalanyl-tRNA--protein transferase [Ignavibacteria bacterium]
MYIYQLDKSFVFPPDSAALAEGLLAIGGDLHPDRLIKAYSQGIFPWYEEDQPILWWSPDPRMVLKPNQIIISKSLRKIIREQQFEIKMDTRFSEVIQACGTSMRNGANDTWITSELKQSFIQLHEKELAHSVEAYQNGILVGGLYGLSIGSIFFGESMFFKVSNASKVAFTYLCNFLNENNFDLIDAQQDTSHLRSLGANTISRTRFLKLLKEYTIKPSLIGKWNTNSCKSELLDLNL